MPKQIKKESDVKFDKRGGSRKFSSKRDDSKSYDLKDKKDIKSKFRDAFKAKVQCMNDPSWYVVHPDLLKDVASLPFSEWMGRSFRGINASVNAVQSTILSIPFFFCPGVGYEATSALNLATRSLYVEVRHANSGHTNYESADLGIYLFVLGTLIARAAHLERVLGIAKYYQTRNAAVPLGLATALHITNFGTLQDNLANYTGKLNTIWVRLSSLCLPKDFNFIKRWIWMCSHVFKDHPTDKAALMAFVPCRSEYLPTAVPTGGCVKLSMQTPDSFQQFLDDLNADISTVLSDEDMGIMSGDILKAYGRENMIQYNMTPIDYVVEPAFVEEMLPQIHNLMTLPARAISGGGTELADRVTNIPHQVASKMTAADFAATANVFNSNIGAYYLYQAGGDLVFTPGYMLNGVTPYLNTNTGSEASGSYSALNWPVGGRILNTFTEHPTPEDVIVATRLQYCNGAQDTSGAYGLTSAGSEIVPYLELQTVAVNGTVVTDVICNIVSGANPAAIGSYRKHFLDLLQLDYAPICYVKSDTTSLTVDEVHGDFDNYTTLSSANVDELNTNAILGEFTVTAMNFTK